MKIKGVVPVLLWAVAGAFTSFAEAPTSDPDICERHHLKMTRQEVAIRYGFPGARNMAFLNAAYAQFPHSGMPVEGGCVVGDNSPKTREVFVCSRCHAEAVAWLKQYKEPESKVESRTTARSQGSVAVGAN